MDDKKISELNEGETDLFDIIAHHVTSGQYKDGWDEDKWEEQMEEHPLFMTKTPEGDLPPLVEAIAQIKYEEESGDKTELANNYKEDGNQNFRLKKYHWAIDCYRKAIECKVDDNQLNSILYNNRASANFHLGNYRSSMLDALQAIKLNGDNRKATFRAVECMIKLKKYQFCIDFCRKSKFSPELQAYQSKALEALEQLEREAKKTHEEEKRLFTLQQKIYFAVEKRKIKYSGSLFDPSHPAAEGHHVHLNDKEELIWPVLFVYPEFGQTDFIVEFNENDSFDQHFSLMFPLNEDHPNWDVERKYRPDNLKVAFQDARTGQIHPFKVTRKLKQILTDPKFKIISSIPTFIVVPIDKSFQS